MESKSRSEVSSTTFPVTVQLVARLLTKALFSRSFVRSGSISSPSVSAFSMSAPISISWIEPCAATAAFCTQALLDRRNERTTPASRRAAPGAVALAGSSEIAVSQKFTRYWRRSRPPSPTVMVSRSMVEENARSRARCHRLYAAPEPCAWGYWSWVRAKSVSSSLSPHSRGPRTTGCRTGRRLARTTREPTSRAAPILAALATNTTLRRMAVSRAVITVASWTIVTVAASTPALLHGRPVKGSLANASV